MHLTKHATQPGDIKGDWTGPSSPATAGLRRTPPLPAGSWIDRVTRLNERGVMPREQINHPPMTDAEASLSPTPTRGAHWAEPSLHIGWHPGAWVQVGLEVDIDYAKFAISSPNGSTSDRTQMWTDVLTLEEVDKLIATLKRARRKVFQQIK